jgi:hypothetical protein
MRMSEDLWAEVFLCLAPCDTFGPALASRLLSKVLRRDGLWNAFAARKAPKNWLVLSSQPPGRERFRRATLLERNRRAPPGVTEPLTCVVTVTSGDAVVFLARFPFEPAVVDDDEEDQQAGMLSSACSLVGSRHGSAVEPEILDSFPALPASDEASPCPLEPLETSWLLERPDGRVAQLVTFRDHDIKDRDGSSDPDAPFSCLSMWYETTLRVDPSLRPWRFELGLTLEFPRHTDQVRVAVAAAEFFAANWYQQGGWDGNREDDEPSNKTIFYHYAMDSRDTAHWTVEDSFRSMLSHLDWN